MTTTSTLPTIDYVSSHPVVRLSLKPACEHPGTVQGAWWPRSRNLNVELPPLVAVLDKQWAETIRTTVNVTMWPDIPHVLHVGRHNVHVGWYDAEQDPDDICLFTYCGGRLDLLVVPPETDSVQGAGLMAAAADVHNHQTAGALLAAATAL